jgi:hypothetical protein
MECPYPTQADSRLDPDFLLSLLESVFRRHHAAKRADSPEEVPVPQS